MGLKLFLEWFEKNSDDVTGSEYSRDLRDKATAIEQLGLSQETTANNGSFDVKDEWIGILQPYFKHSINKGALDYQISFPFREEWPAEIRFYTWNLYHSGFRKERNTYIVSLIPEKSGEIISANYKYDGNSFPRSMMRIHLLGTQIDCNLGKKGQEIEFKPQQKQITEGQAIEVRHTVDATKTNHDELSFGKPLNVFITLKVNIN